jgi:GT2 family glycosyltransferase
VSDPAGGLLISVVVPTRGRTTRLYLTLSALARQSLARHRFEVVVVDDSPEGETAAAVSRAVPGLRDVRLVHTGGMGVASARNAGVQASASDIILFLDDDTLAAEALVESHLTAHADDGRTVVHGVVTDLIAFKFAADDTGTEPLATTLVGENGRSLGPADLDRLDQAARSFGRRRSFIESLAAAAVADGRLPWLVCVGTNTSLRRSAFDAVGGFDVRYNGLWGGEDLELGLRLNEAGYGFTLIASAAYHVATARYGTEYSITEFWARAARYHDNPSLIKVADLLRGRASLEETAAAFA